MPLPRTPALTADAVIVDAARGVVLVRRRHAPFAGYWALPGGFVEIGESCVTACRREAKEETGLDIECVELVGVFSDPSRDARGHTISAVYLCRVVGGELSGGDDAAEARWFPDVHALDLAFDHRQVLAAAGIVSLQPEPS